MKVFFCAICLVLSAVSCPLIAKIRILTFHFNKPEFLELQCKTLDKFMKDEYELIVFNDAVDPQIERKIEEVCKRYKIQYVRYEQQWHETDPLNDYIYTLLQRQDLIHSHVSFFGARKDIARNSTLRHSHVIQYALDHFGYDHDDIVVILDGDCFPIRPISLREWFKDHQIIGINRRIEAEDIEYLWVPFVAFDITKLPNKRELKFHPDMINGYFHDTGSHVYHYLNNHPEVSVRRFSGYSSTVFHGYSIIEMRDFGFNFKEALFAQKLPWPLCVEFQMENCFLHFGASSFGLEGDDVKSRYVVDFLNEILGPARKK